MMVRTLNVFFCGVFAVSIISGGCGQREEPVRQSNPGLPALTVNKNAPLLLDEPAQTQKVLTQAETKNATCYVCHANYEQEPLVQWHAKANYACSDCHGESIAHKNDENNITPPDKMYAPDEIDAACRKCHTSHDIQPAEVVRRWREHIGDTKTDVLCEKCHEGHDVPAADVVRKWQKQGGQKIEEKPIVCTDCHGQHRLKMRSVRYR
jgi:uncharacterized CHY-type Zn-finger protein